MGIPESTPTPRRVGRAMAWGVAIGVGAVVLRELVRPREQPARLIDWERVEEIALARCGEPQDRPADPANLDRGECGESDQKTQDQRVAAEHTRTDPDAGQEQKEVHGFPARVKEWT